MTIERWENIINNIKDNFEVEEHGSRHEDGMGGIDIDFIIFKGPLGMMKLEFITKPAILDKKTTYSRRIGSETKVDYIYSDTEKSSKFIAYKWNEDQEAWVEIDSKSFSS